MRTTLSLFAFLLATSPALEPAPLHAQELTAEGPSAVGLVLFPTSPYDPLISRLQADLRVRAGTGREVPVELGASILGPVGTDPGAWRQASAFVRAALWFTLGRQRLAASDSAGTIGAFQKTRAILEEGGLLVRPPLLGSIALISGRLHAASGDVPGATAAFRAAALVDPTDASAELVDEATRSLYLAARQSVTEAPRIPVKIEANQPDATLFVNGARANGSGPHWLLELPPGRHLLTVVKEGARPAGAGVALSADGARPLVRLELEPGTGGAATLRPFALVETTAFVEQIRAFAAARGQTHVVIETVIGPVEGRQPAAPGPRVGIHGALKVNPGPDSGDAVAPPGPVRVETFRVGVDGSVESLGIGEVSP